MTDATAFGNATSLEGLYTSKVQPRLFRDGHASLPPSAAVVLAPHGLCGSGLRAALHHVGDAAAIVLSRSSMGACLAGSYANHATAGPNDLVPPLVLRAGLDAIQRNTSFVVQAGPSEVNAAATLLRHLAGQPFKTAIVAIAVPTATSRMALAAKLALLCRYGVPPRWTDVMEHDAWNASLPRHLENLMPHADRIELARLDGSPLLPAGAMSARGPTHVIDVVRSIHARPSAPRRVADEALQAGDIARELGALGSVVPAWARTTIVRWCEAAMTKAQCDPVAAELVCAGQAAQSLRTGRDVSQVPAHYADKLEQAIRFAHENFHEAVDRDRFVLQARTRLAERLYEGNVTRHPPDRASPSR